MTDTTENTISKKNLIAFRGYHPDDRNFILSTWLNVLYYNNDLYHAIHKASYFTAYDRIIKTILDRPGTFAHVACLQEDPSVILGYAIFEKREAETLLHWMFIKFVWRGIGLARDLIEPIPFSHITHLTNLGQSDQRFEMILRCLKKLKKKKILFNPFLL